MKRVCKIPIIETNERTPFCAFAYKTTMCPATNDPYLLTAPKIDPATWLKDDVLVLFSSQDVGRPCRLFLRLWCLALLAARCELLLLLLTRGIRSSGIPLLFVCDLWNVSACRYKAVRFKHTFLSL